MVIDLLCFVIPELLSVCNLCLNVFITVLSFWLMSCVTFQGLFLLFLVVELSF